MRYSFYVLLSVSALAAVTITACQRQPAGDQPQPVQVSQQSAANQNPDPMPGSRVGEDSPRGDGPQTGQESPSGDEPAPDRDTPDDDQPLLLSDDDPPLELDDGPLLLLDDGEEGSPDAAGPVADNSRCHHCHLNYIDEELAVVHARANIGCADCHGESDEHIADESWSWGENGTAPDTMYPREKINAFCLGCHPKDDIPALEHKSFLAGEADEKYCTDCHGDHRLAERKCKWK